MHRRLLKPLATVMGAAALMVAPIALIAPSAQAEPLTTPDATVPFSAAANQLSFWVNWLDENRDIDNATCVNGPGDIDDETWTIPAPPSGTEFVLVVTKAAAGEQANWAFFDPMQGDTVVAVDGKEISHVIWCTVPKMTPPPSTTPPVTTPPVTTPPVTGPVVETDRVADTGPVAGLGLAAGAAALVAGMGAMLFSRRRQGNYR
jgi:hypothetical protein